MTKEESQVDREAAEKWASSQDAQAIANTFEKSHSFFMGQQKTFQAHIDGQRIGYIEGIAHGRATAIKEILERYDKEMDVWYADEFGSDSRSKEEVALDFIRSLSAPVEGE